MAPTPPRTASVRLKVNGALHEIDAHPGDSLAWVLRARLGLAGVRIGCGLEQCGACRVIVDGEARSVCAAPAGEFEGCEIRTVEGLGGDDPVQRALIEANAGQCGFCLSGIVMSARALFDAKPHPTRAEIRAALRDNLCRCGAQPRILRALERLATDG